MKLVAAAMIACMATAFAADPAPVKGNPDSKVYHKPACRHYSGKSCTKEFTSEAEAVKAGYAPCKQCAAPKKEQKEKPAGNSQ
jgi:methylphosphotriester-DNA--protein-cysteine methyltransferase